MSDPELDRAIEAIVRRLACLCCAPDAATARAIAEGATPEILDALRLIDGIADDQIDRQKLGWLLERATHRLVNRVDTHLSQSARLSDNLKTAASAELGEMFAAVMAEFEHLLLPGGAA